MQFAVLVYEKPGTYEALSAAELEQMTAEYFAIAQLPGYIGGAQLQSIETASAVRVEGGETLITDGPFANTKEVFGGFYLFEAESLDPVLEIAARCPAARLGGVVEVRPLVHLHGYGGYCLIERVFRERWRRVLASMVGYVGDFDLAEESTQEAFAIALRLPATTATISGWVFSVAQVPIGASNARSGTDQVSIATAVPACAPSAFVG